MAKSYIFEPRPRGYKTFFMLKSTEHEISTAHIYILNVAALDETIIPSCLHFSMQNIEQSHGLGCASRWSNVNVNQ